ncbi:MAG: hypothetical protein KAQ90_09770 [Melioribacteraceae bacterium]|nr:hypothetical protein [Melioribacteraceae bacterium]
MITQTKNIQNMITPEIALKFLKDGNKRFFNNKPFEGNYNYQLVKTSKGQFPFAVILSCIDSRIPTDIIFDKKIGDLFNVRIAGNIVNEDILGSMEFACKLSGAKLILVLGHTECGAVKGACENAQLGNLTGLLKKLEPALNSVSTSPDVERSSKNKDFVNDVALKNIELTIEQIKQQSPVLNEMLQKNEIDIAGAMYKVETGEVEFLS